MVLALVLLLGCAGGDPAAPAAIGRLAYSTDGQWLAAAHADGQVTVLEVAGPRRWRLPASGAVLPRIALTEDGSLLAVGGADKVVLWKVADRQIARELPLGAGAIVSLKFSDAPDPLLLASVDRAANPAGNLKIWRIADGVLVGLISGSPLGTFTHADEAVLLLDESQARYDVVSFQGTPRAGAAFPRPLALTAFAADGAFMAGILGAGSDDERLATLSVQDQSFVWQSTEKTRATRELVFLENPSRVVQLAERVLIYDHDNGQVQGSLPALVGARAAIAAPDGSTLAAVAADGKIVIVSSSDGSIRTLAE